MGAKNLARANYISSELLGRKRETVEIVTEEPIENIMKEVETDTTIDRHEVMDMCEELLNEPLHELNHDYALKGLKFAFDSNMPPQMVALDASQAWMVYWIANSMQVFNETTIDEENKRKMVEKLFLMSEDKGPFSGGEGQLPHIASTYAAVNALALCDNFDNCWDQLDRKAIYKWLLSLKQTDGGFTTCNPVGERDIRGVYCALSVASLLNIMTDELIEGVLEYLQKCQTFEGGFGATLLQDEAHGGYTFCAVASLCILNKLHTINVEKLMEWCSARQYNEEMGLCGRGNKLVDGCYSFWVGSTAAMIEATTGVECINKQALRKYILNCCQSTTGISLRDKPGKNGDFYHTNYVLMGLAITESTFKYKMEPNKKSPFDLVSIPSTTEDKPSDLSSINPIYGLPSDVVRKFHKHFV